MIGGEGIETAACKLQKIQALAILQIYFFILQILFFILQILFYRFDCLFYRFLCLFYRFYFLFYRFYFRFYFKDFILKIITNIELYGSEYSEKISRIFQF